MSGEELFRGIDQVDWREVHHAYGPATDIPELLYALALPTKQVRSAAWHELYGNIWHQGTIYEATSCAVPFLIQLLEASEVCDKAEILAYLSALFTGQGYWQVHGGSSRPDKPAKKELEQVLIQERSWVERTRVAIRAGNESYFTLLRQGDSRARLAAAYLLGLIGETELEIIEEILKTR